jgi:hypothetical protein
VEKHGFGSFEFLVLEETERTKLVPREQYWIDYFDSANFLKGYNIRPTADNKVISEKMKENMRKNHADFSGEKHPRFIPRIRKICACGCGKEIIVKSSGSRSHIRLLPNHGLRGNKNPNYNPKLKRKAICVDCGKIVLPKSSRCRICDNKNRPKACS